MGSLTDPEFVFLDARTPANVANPLAYHLRRSEHSKIALACWHREVYAIWAEALADFKPTFYTGSESTTQKDESKRRFVEGETNLMIISLRSGAGLDGLQTAAPPLSWASSTGARRCTTSCSAASTSPGRCGR